MSYYSINEDDRRAASEPMKSEVIPEGAYTCVVVKVEDKETKQKTGRGPNLELVVDEGEHKGTKVWDHLLLDHPNAQTRGIAKRNWAVLCMSLGMPNGPDQLSDVCYKRFQVVLKVEPANGQYGARNRVRYYVLPESAKPVADAAQPAEPRGDWLHTAPDAANDKDIPF
jgi:hypothetical protein